MNKLGDDSDDSDIEIKRSLEMMEDVRCTYIVRRDPPNRKMTLAPKRMRDRNDMMREKYPSFKGRYDSDEEEYAPSLQGRESPPITTCFKTKNRQVMPIRELIERPWRSRRPSRICIFIRGPLYSGKSYISKCIIEKEKSYGNDKAQRINGVKLARRREDQGRDGPNLLFEEFENAAKSGCKFLVVEIKSRKRSVFETCIRLAETYEYEMYGIDIIVDVQSKSYKSKAREVGCYSYETMTKAYVKEIKAFPMPRSITMVNPVGIFPNTYKIPLYMNNVDDFSKNHNYGQPKTCEDDFSVVDDATYDISTVKDIYDYFPENIRYSVNFEDDVVDKIGDLIVNKIQAPYKSVIDLHLEKFPSCEPKKVIEYEHKTKWIDDGKILEVNPSKIFDYSHNRTQYLLNMVADIDIDTVIEEKKAKKIDQKLNFYKQFEMTEGMTTSVYPQNWEKINIQRPPLNGKRKKNKTKKILKILDQKSMTTVQKGVKRMKLEDPNSQGGDQEDASMNVDIEAAIPYYIDEIMNKIKIDGKIEDNNQKAFDYIRTLYVRLNDIPEMSTILQLVAQVDHLKIKFNFCDGKAFCYNPKENLMEINVSNVDEADILRTLGHQLMHCAAHWTFKNNAKPFVEHDDDKKEELQRVFIGIEIIESEKHENFRKMMNKYCESVWDVEVIGIFGELIVDGQTDELKKVDNLWEFYTKMFEAIENFGKRFKSGTKRGVF
ncbi:hypothetical protein ACKWTF_016193 [Chironomus riparius]